MFIITVKVMINSWNATVYYIILILQMMAGTALLHGLLQEYTLLVDNLESAPTTISQTVSAVTSKESSKFTLV